MSAGSASGPIDPLQRLQAASANYQQTARWVAGSFGALGVALVAGLSLSGLGTLPGWRLALSITGVMLALVAVAVVVHRTALVAPLEYLTFEEVDVAAGQGEDGDELRETIQRRDGLFPSTFGHREPHRLRARMAVLERDLQADAHRDDRHDIEAELAECRKVANKVLAFANHYEAKRSYERLWRTVVVGAFTFVTGAALFAWSANPAPTATDPITVVVVTETPETEG